MAGESPSDADGPRLRPGEVRQVFELAETSQGLLDAFFRIACDYFPACVLVFFVGEDAIVRRAHGANAKSVSIGARFARDESPALGALRGAALGAAVVPVSVGDALVGCGAWTPGDALLLPLIVRGRAVAVVLGEARITDGMRKDLIDITTMAVTALQSIIARRQSGVAAISEATQILTAQLEDASAKGVKRKKMSLMVTAVTGGVVLCAMLFFFFGGRKSPTLLGLNEVPGQPQIDISTLVPVVQKAAGLESSELVSLRATVGPDGKTNLLEPGLGADPWPARLVFASGDRVAELELDRAGLYPPSVHGRGTNQDTCGPCGCDMPAPKPRCAVSKIVESARSAGLGPAEAAVVTYSFCRSDGPRWTLGVPGRGEIRLSDSTCGALEHESLQGAPRKLDTLPGAPRVDALALIEEARNQSGIPTAALVKVEAWFAASDGTVDVRGTGRRGRVEYTFAEAKEGPNRRVRRVIVDADGMSVRSDETLDNVRPVPKPGCTIRALRRSALAGAPEAELAHVIYEVDSSPERRGLWTIELAASAVHQVQTDAVCSAWK